MHQGDINHNFTVHNNINIEFVLLYSTSSTVTSFLTILAVALCFAEHYSLTVFVLGDALT